jgi:hypothetical protein
MSRIGEFEKTIVAEPIEEPLPVEKTPQKVPEKPATEPLEVSP